MTPLTTTTPIFASDTDMYSLISMAHAQFACGQHEDEVTFNMYFPRLPENYGYGVFAGLADILAFLQDMRLEEEDLEYIAAVPGRDGKPMFGKAFVDYLRGLRFTGQVYAVPEGTIVGARVPVLRVTAPRIQGTIIEATLLATAMQASAVATKAARVVDAAQGIPTWEGSLRRQPGVSGGPAVARAAYIAGMTGTSNVRAARILGIPVAGTMAHAYVLGFGEDGEQTAFETWLTTNPPELAVMLVDTYDARRGIRRAIAASQATGVPLVGVRIDSGDLGELATYARQQLDAAGMNDVKVMLSGGLDEFQIAELVAAGAPIDSILVGTAVGNPGPMDIVYKLVEQEAFDDERRYVMKKAIGKQTDPGKHVVFEIEPGRQVIALADELVPGARRQLMHRVMALGKVTAAQPDLDAVRAHVAEELNRLPADVRKPVAPTPIDVTRTEKLWALRAQLGDTAALQRAEKITA